MALWMHAGLLRQNEKFFSDVVFLTVEWLNWKKNVSWENEVNVLQTCFSYLCSCLCYWSERWKAMKLSKAHAIKENLTVSSASAQSPSESTLLTKSYQKFAQQTKTIWTNLVESLRRSSWLRSRWELTVSIQFSEFIMIIYNLPALAAAEQKKENKLAWAFTDRVFFPRNRKICEKLSFRATSIKRLIGWFGDTMTPAEMFLDEMNKGLNARSECIRVQT